MESKFWKLFALMAVVCLLAGCGGAPAAETQAQTVPTVTEPAPVETTEADEEPTEESIANGMEYAPAETLGVTVETPYITLYCPEEWQDIVKLDQKEENGSYTLTFHTAVADTDVVLFSLIFSTAEAAEGFPLGRLEDETAGTVYVFAAMNETLPEHWREEEITQFGAMQERVNDLIMQLNEDPRFDSGR